MSNAVAAPTAASVRPRRSRWQFALGLLVVAALLVAGDTIWRQAQNRPPYGPEAVSARVSLAVVTADQALPLLRRLAPPNTVDPSYTHGVGTERTNVVGRLTFAVPPQAAKADAYYAFFIVDRATGGPLQRLYGYEKGHRVSSGWDSAYNAIGARYPALAGVGISDASNPFGQPGMSIGFAPDAPGSVVFDGALAAPAPPGGRISDEVSVVLALLSSDDHLYWATSVPITALR